MLSLFCTGCLHHPVYLLYAAGFWRIGFTCSFPASSLISPHLLHLCSCLYTQLSDKQPVPHYQKPDFSALPTSDLLSAYDFWTLSLLLPPDYHPLLNHWIRLPESSSPFTTLLLCPDQRLKPLPRIL
ncbi:hypothetical protein ATANTOWER_030732 [Ataeniobius toweri]|uniref:Uncharacterized protein n=1 Tax=Ataeniobius toweri TaxID=208326 RepID=A0ABU7BLR6_9TELE|nr:hypothetical protein [Ataeniobius toweri]